MTATTHRLRKHADYQRVYKASRKHSGKQMSYFFLLRQTRDGEQSPACDAATEGPRVGLTVGKAMGKAVDRNRIKRRMRAVIRKQLPLLDSRLDVVLHPRRGVIDLDFATLEREVASVFQAIQRVSQRQPTPSSSAIEPPSPGLSGTS